MSSSPTSPTTYNDWTTWSAEEPGTWSKPAFTSSKMEAPEEAKIVELIDFGDEDSGNHSASSTESIVVKPVVGTGRPGRQDRVNDMVFLKPVQKTVQNVGPICRDFARHSACPRGYVCKFKHLTRSELARHNIDLGVAMREASPFNDYAPDVQARIKKDLNKTKLCKDFLGGNCQRDGRCYFAHIAGHDAQRVIDTLNKSKLCPWLKHTDACKSGRSCPFNHSRAYKRGVAQKGHVRQILKKPEPEAIGVIADAGKDIPDALETTSAYFETVEKTAVDSSSSSGSGKESEESVETTEKDVKRDLVTEYLAKLSLGSSPCL